MDAAKTTVTVPEAARMLGISRNLAYQLAQDGALAGVPVIRLGRRMVIPRTPFLRALGLEDKPAEVAG